MDISVVIPLYNEEESLPELYAWIERVMKEQGFSFEVIFVNDGSTDHSWQIIKELSNGSEQVKGIKFRRNYGKSPALFCGFKEAQGDVVITMDADLQDSPDEIPELYRMITQEGYDLVSGYKQKRYDPLSKTLPTKLFNATARKISGIRNLHDFNCGLKAYRKEVIKNIEVYGEMHRYIPYLAKNAGFGRIGEKVVQHQARKFGKSKFMGLNRFVQSCDVAGIAYVQILCLSALCCFAAIFFERVSIVPVMDRSFFVAMAVICLLGTVFGFFAQALMQKYTTPVKTALFFTLEPVTAGIMGVFVGGERLSAMQILGAALILSGVLISEIGSYLSAKRSRSADV